MNTKHNTSEIKKRIQSFPGMPAMCGKLLSKMNNPDADFKTLSNEMKYDPGMTTNVLRLANSAYFGAPGKINSLQAAFVRLGTKQLLQLITSTAVSGILNKPLVGYNLMPEELLRHSVWTAVASGEIAQILGIHAPDMLFTAGLLHDIGKIVLDSLVKDEWGQMKDSINNQNYASFEEVEHAVLGLDHAEAGAQILESWNFPEELIVLIRNHHNPETTEKYQELVNIIHLADVLAYSQGIGSGVDGFHYQVSEKAVANLEIKNIEGIASRTLEKMEELEKLLNI